MKVELIDDETFIVYLTDLTDPTILDDEDKLRFFLKDLLFKIKKMLKGDFHGYYQLKAYVAAPVMILEFFKIDEYSENVDLNIIIQLNSDIYFEFSEPELILGKKIYYKRKFYVPVEKIFDLISVIEFGRFIYGEELDTVREHGFVCYYSG